MSTPLPPRRASGLALPGGRRALGLAVLLTTRALLGAEAPAPSTAPAPAVENSVVKVFSTVRHPDVFKPWTKSEPTDITGSGVVIEGRRILTNAHVVLYASQIQVQANQAGDKVSARVEMIAPGIDLAVLKLDDDSFFDTHAPLPRAAAVPAIKDPVLVYGYPTGGTSLSITKGIVSRIEFTNYNHPVFGLRIQIDAAINPGNSGGPAVVADRMIGLAFSYLGEAEKISYIIPSEEIDLFLQDIADGTYDGKPAFYDSFQTLENPAMRRFLKLAKTDEGVIIHQTDSVDPAYPLKEWDLVTRVAGIPVDDEGMVHQGDLRVGFRYLVQKVAKNGRVPMDIVRAGAHLHVEVPVPHTHAMLIPSLEGAYPPYFIYGPLVFSKATAGFVNPLAHDPKLSGALIWDGSPLLARRGETPAFPGEELVVVASPFFPTKLSEAYANPDLHVLRTVNGIPIRNLRQLVEVLRDCRDEYVAFEFYERNKEAPVFPRKAMLAATEEILTDNGVRAQASPELLAVWQAKPSN